MLKQTQKFLHIQSFLSNLITSPNISCYLKIWLHILFHSYNKLTNVAYFNSQDQVTCLFMQISLRAIEHSASVCCIMSLLPAGSTFKTLLLFTASIGLKLHFASVLVLPSSGRYKRMNWGYVTPPFITIWMNPQIEFRLVNYSHALSVRFIEKREFNSPNEQRKESDYQNGMPKNSTVLC